MRPTPRTTTEDIQRLLVSHGYDPGPVDGVHGRRTIEAIRRFQADRRLMVRWPGTVGQRTLLALLGAKTDLTNDGHLGIVPPWYAELRRRVGLHERRNRKALAAWLRSDGRTLGDPAELPWCGDAVATAIALTVPNEPLPANPYLARAWLSFGRALAEPAVGAVGIAWRGRRDGHSGHVFLYAGETATHILALGGNQRNAITDDALIARDRILGWRWPTNHPEPYAGRVQAAAGGIVSTDEA